MYFIGTHTHKEIKYCFIFDYFDATKLNELIIFPITIFFRLRVACIIMIILSNRYVSIYLHHLFRSSEEATLLFILLHNRNHL